MKELNFKEVIANIKEGETWENNDRIISCKNGSILMKNKNMIKSDCFLFPTYNLFELRRKEYTFEEVFKAYEEGKEVESISYRYKKINGQDKFHSKTFNGWSDNENFTIEEIKSKWYIND